MRLLPIKQIVVHHSAIQGIYFQYEQVRQYHFIKGYGRKTAYNWFLEKNGKLIEARGNKMQAAGTQSWKANHNGIHVCCAGHFEIEEPTEEQLKVLKIMSKEKNLPLIGHRDVSPSKCPGKNLYFKLNKMNKTIKLAQRLWASANNFKLQVEDFQGEMEDIQREAHEIAEEARNS